MTRMRQYVFTKTNQVIIDLVVFLVAWLAAYFARFEGSPTGHYFGQMLFFLPAVLLFRVLSFHFLSIYSINN